MKRFNNACVESFQLMEHLQKRGTFGEDTNATFREDTNRTSRCSFMSPRLSKTWEPLMVQELLSNNGVLSSVTGRSEVDFLLEGEFWCGIARQTRSFRPSPVSTLTLTRTDLSVTKIQQTFKNHDLDMDGYLSAEEVVGAARENDMDLQLPAAHSIISHLNHLRGQESEIDLPSFGHVCTQLNLAHLFTPDIRDNCSQTEMKLTTIKYNTRECVVTQRIALGSLEDEAAVKHFFFEVERATEHERFTKWTHFDASRGMDSVTLHRIVAKYGLHPLLVGDILDDRTPPKFDRYSNQAFIKIDITSLISRADHPSRVRVDKSSLSVLVANDSKTVISILQDEPDETSWMSLWRSRRMRAAPEEGGGGPAAIAEIWERLQDDLHQPGCRVREFHGDFLVYEMLSRVISEWQPITEAYARRLGHMHQQGPHKFTENWLVELAEVGFELKEFIRSVRPTSRLVRHLAADRDFDQKVRIYMDSLQDSIEEYLVDMQQLQEMANALVQSHRECRATGANSTLYVLSVVSVIFLPMSLFTGIYGMNFEKDDEPNIPELLWADGYRYFWYLQLGIVCFTVIFLILLHHFAGGGNILDHLSNKCRRCSAKAWKYLGGRSWTEPPESRDSSISV